MTGQCRAEPGGAWQCPAPPGYHGQPFGHTGSCRTGLSVEGLESLPVGWKDEAEGVAEAALKDVDHEGGEDNGPGEASFSWPGGWSLHLVSSADSRNKKVSSAGNVVAAALDVVLSLTV